MRTRYPTAEQVHSEFELRGTELWRKQRTDTIGKTYKAKRINTQANYTLGYCLVSCAGRTVLCHHLIWILYNGDIPPDKTIDHKNGVRDDNRIENLQLADMRQQNSNRPIHRAGKLPGCRYCEKYRGLWEARLKIDGRFVTIGFFLTEVEAHRAYMVACGEVHTQKPPVGTAEERKRFRVCILSKMED